MCDPNVNENLLKVVTEPEVSEEVKIDAVVDKSYKLGESSVYPVDVTPVGYKNLPRNVENDIIKKVFASVDRRDDIVEEREYETIIHGRCALQSNRMAERQINVDATFERFWAAGINPPLYTIGFDSAYPIDEFTVTSAPKYINNMIPESKAITSAIKGVVLMNRDICEGVATTMLSQLIIYDLQYIFFQAHLLTLKLNERREGFAACNVVWPAPAAAFVNHIDVSTRDNAAAGVAIQALLAAQNDGNIVLISRDWSDADIQAMTAISMGIQAMQLTRAGRAHVTNGWRNENLHWTLVGDRERVIPQFNPPTANDISGFADRLAVSLSCLADQVKGTIRACSIFYGRTMSYNVRDDVTVLARGLNDMPLPAVQAPVMNAVEVAQQEARREYAELRVERQGIEDQIRVLNDEMTALLAARPDLMHMPDVRLPPAEGQLRVEGALYADDLDEAQMQFFNLERQRGSRVVRRILIDNRREVLVADANDAGYDIRAAGAAGIVRAYDLFIPASLEIGGMRLPQPTGSNWLWRLLRLNREQAEPPEWCVADRAMLAALPVGRFGQTMAMIAALISSGTSIALHTLNITGQDIQTCMSAVRPNVYELWEQLSLARDIRSNNCLIAEQTCRAVENMTGWTINPLCYYMADFANGLRHVDDRRPTGAYYVISGPRIIYLQHPICLAQVITKFPEVWGYSAAGISVDVTEEIDFTRDLPNRGWRADLGCRKYEDSFNTNSEKVYIAYGVFVLNAYTQNANQPNFGPRLSFRRYVKTMAGKGDRLDTVRVETAVYHAPTFSFWPGTILSYTHATRTTISPMVRVDDNDGATVVRSLAQFHKGFPLDAGFILLKAIRTYVAANSVPVALMGGLFLGGDDEDDGAASSSKSDAAKKGN